VPSEMSNNPDATAAYRAGMQALRDGAVAAARKQLIRAVALEPLFGAAQLRLALTKPLQPGISAITSADLQGAHAAQASLGTHDRILLDAFELVAREPPDYEGGRKVLEAAARRYPTDADFPFQLGLLLDFAGQPTEAAKAVEVSLERDATFAAAWNLKGFLLSELGEAMASVDAFAQCVKVSPGATSCFLELAFIEINEGKCEDAVATARRLIPLLPPDVPLPYFLLAEALAGAGEPEEAVHAALQQYFERSLPPQRAREPMTTGGALAILRGDFAGAEQQYENADRLPETSAIRRFVEIYPRVLLNVELGRKAKAIRLAEGYLRERTGLAPEDLLLVGPLAVQAAERAAGGVSREAFIVARDRWLALNKDADPVQRWIEAYARPAETRQEANDALAAMPDVKPLLPLLSLDPAFAEPVGRTLALAGRVEDALLYLTAASSSCSILEGYDAIYSTLATFELGRALEDRGDTPGACAAYNRVLARWGKTSPPARTAMDARERERALGCAP